MIGKPSICVVYEDSRTRPGEFALHRAILFMVADQAAPQVVASDPWSVAEPFRAHVCDKPLRGVGNALNALPRFGEEYAHVLALLDRDHITDHVPGLATAAPSGAHVLAALRQRRTISGNVHLYLLHENLEDLIMAIDPAEPPPTKGHAYRERHVGRMLAAGRDGHRRRTRVREAQPELDALVTHLCRLLFPGA